jgi:nucleoside-diphosphate-sugar epimerase
MKNILVTGGAGYVGSALVPELLKHYNVTVIDLMIYGNKLPRNNKNLKIIKGDIRDKAKVIKATKGIDCVIHLACISNDPSFELKS